MPIRKSKKEKKSNLDHLQQNSIANILVTNWKADKDIFEMQRKFPFPCLMTIYEEEESISYAIASDYSKN